MFKLILKGIVLGFSNAIPGVSAGTMALIMGIYDKMLRSIDELFTSKEYRFKSLRFLILVGIGIVIGGLFCASILTWAFSISLLETLTFIFIIGLVLGSIPMIFKLNEDMKPTFFRVFLLFLACSLAVLLSIQEKPPTENFMGDAIQSSFLGVFNITTFRIQYALKFLSLGAVTSATMIIPGISGSALLVSLGEYQNILNVISQRLLIQGIFFALGILIGIVTCAKAISCLIKKYPAQTYYFIIGLLGSSIFQVSISTNWTNVLSPVLIVVSIILLLLGFILSFKLGKIKEKREESL